MFKFITAALFSCHGLYANKSESFRFAFLHASEVNGEVIHLFLTWFQTHVKEKVNSNLMTVSLESLMELFSSSCCFFACHTKALVCNRWIKTRPLWHLNRGTYLEFKAAAWDKQSRGSQVCFWEKKKKVAAWMHLMLRVFERECAFDEKERKEYQNTLQEKVSGFSLSFDSYLKNSLISSSVWCILQDDWQEWRPKTFSFHVLKELFVRWSSLGNHYIE